MHKRKLYNKIREILVLTQFEHWVEPKNISPTAEEANLRSGRALDYYLGIKNKKAGELPDYEMTRFHAIVDTQTGLIIRALENDESFLEYCKERDDGYTNP